MADGVDGHIPTIHGVPNFQPIAADPCEDRWVWYNPVLGEVCMLSSETVLQQYFGYERFRPYQREAVEAVLAGRDVFVLMPTGGGKSLCYTVPSVMMPGLTVVVSPLISLMKDQVDALRQNGVAATYLNSSLDEQTQQKVIDQIKHGGLSMLYVAPERLVQLQFVDLLKSIKLNFFAIDEAHCISQWGHDFRPEYRQLSILRR